jgi:O-antigen ligase
MVVGRRLKKVPFFLFLLGVFFLPFNSFDGIEVLGEFKRDSCFIFFLLSGLFLFFRKKISLPINDPIFKLLIVILIYFFLSGLLNFYDLSNYFFKGISGFSRFIRQYVSLVISSVLSLWVFYNVLKNYNVQKIFLIIRKTILYSLFIVTVYALIEFLIIKMGIIDLIDLLNIFDYFPFTKVNIDWTTKRMSSVTFESPALATYLLSISGWMFSFILTEDNWKKYIPIFLTIVLSFLSGSRAGFFIILVQILVFILYTIKDKKFNKLFVKISISFIVISLFSILFFAKPIYEFVYSKVTSFQTDDDTHALSNKSRFGIQYAMFQVFLNNPIKGTGYGLQAFESKELYPDWAVDGNWEFRLKYLNEDVKSFPPGYNLYLRLLSETGVIGFVVFMIFLLSICLWCYNKTFKRQGAQTIIPLVITISMIGFLINWFKVDTFRVYFFWLCLVLIFLLKKQSNFNVKEKNNSLNSPL